MMRVIAVRISPPPAHHLVRVEVMMRLKIGDDDRRTEQEKRM